MRQRAFVLVSLLFAGMAGAVVVSAQVTTRFKAEHARLTQVGRANALAKHLSERELLRNALLNPFAYVTFNTQKVLPGGSVSVTARGNFPAGTTIISERDGVTISGAALSATTYSARLTIPADEPPGFVRLWAFDPVGIEGPTAVAFVDTLYRFDLKSPNGYTIKVAPVGKTFTILENRSAQLKYQAEFYRPGEATPFETVTGDQTFDPRAAPYESHTPYARLDISFSYSATSSSS